MDVTTRLHENAQALRALNVSQIFSTPDEPDLPDSPVRPTAGSRVEDTQRRESLQLSAEVASLRTSLREADQRTLNVAECHRRQVEIRMTLLEAAYSEALQAKDEAVAEVHTQRALAQAAQQELRMCRQQLELAQRTRDVDIAVLEERMREEAARISNELDTSRVGSKALLAELRSIDDRAEGHMPGTPSSRVVPMPVSVDMALLDLRQWAAVPALAAEGGDRGRDAAKPDARLISHLQRLEEAADAAARRFDELQDDYNALRRRYRQLRQHQRQLAPAAVGSQEAPVSNRTSIPLQ